MGKTVERNVSSVAKFGKLLGSIIPAVTLRLPDARTSRKLSLGNRIKSLLRGHKCAEGWMTMVKQFNFKDALRVAISSRIGLRIM